MLFSRSLSPDNGDLVTIPRSVGSQMRIVRDGIFLVFIGTLFVCVPGCGPEEATVAPRTEEEIEAYKADVYAAEEEDDAAAAEDE